MAVKEKIRIRIKGYDHQLVDQSAEKIVANSEAYWRQSFRPSAAAHREADHHHSARCAQVQGQP